MRPRRIRVNMKEAYNALVHTTRKDITEFLESDEDRLPARSGLFLTDDDEKLPAFSRAPCERVYSRKEVILNEKTGERAPGGARIVLTKDNYGSRASGLGGAGGTKCEAIDIVAGQLSSSRVIHTSTTKSRGNFAEDGARIYLTERGNINHYFATENTDKLTAISDNLKSGIGIKADHVRIIGREHVKIYAGSAMNIAKPNKPLRNILGLNRERNSKGGDITARGRIDLIADNYEDIQPAVKGQNLIEYLRNMQDVMTRVVAEINEINRRNLKLNNALLLAPIPDIGLTFQIFGQYPGQFKTMIGTMVENINLVFEEINYLSDDLPVLGIKNILSDSVYIT